MRMKNGLRIAAGLLLTVGLAGCGTATPPQPGPVIAHGVALREPLVSPRPYGGATLQVGEKGTVASAAGVWCAHAASWPCQAGNGQGEAP
jgi:hypothetical protein